MAKNPYVVLRSEAKFEHRALGNTLKAVKKAGYDCVIYTSIESQAKFNVRQGVTLYPYMITGLVEKPYR